MLIAPPSTVLVTGANGFLSIWICRFLLEQGYTVRGTVRDDGKATYLVDMFSKFGDKFGYVIVKDVAVPHAFDEAVEGVDAVLHTASPIGRAGKPEESSDTIRPAVDGTISTLGSVLKFGTSVRRVVITSSAVSVLEPHDEGYVYTESDWNDSVNKDLNEKGDHADGISVYRASKVLAEKAAWDFMTKHEGQTKFDLVCILPTYLWGPLLQDTTTMKEPNTSVMVLYASIQHERPASQLGPYYSDWVDVRDAGLAHILALQKEEAGNERFIISGGTFSWEEVYDILHLVEPSMERIPFGNPDARSQRTVGTPSSAEKSKKVLGITYRSLDECVEATVVSVREKFPSM